MEVRTISCSKKITAELAVNVDTIEYKPAQGDEDPSWSYFKLYFTIFVGDGSSYRGMILVTKNNSSRQKWLSCYVFDVKSLTGNVSMMISKGKFISESDMLVGYASTRIPNSKVLNILVGADSVTFLKGSFTITFETMEKKTMEKRLINSYSVLKQDQLQEMKEMVLKIPKLDDTIIAQYTSKKGYTIPKSSGRVRGRPRKMT